jgi:hypothetical protein
MKNATGVFMDDTLYIGGGYTGDSRTDPIVCAYNFAYGKIWKQLPPCPLKWSTVTTLGGRLALVGGRVTRGAKPATYTNKVAVWNQDTQEWEFPLPCMVAPRMSPIVIRVGDQLIAAGGKKGSLDYQAEVLDTKTGKWVIGPSLPLRCLSNTSAVVGEEWFLADTSSGVIQHANIREYVAAATRQADSSTTPPSASQQLWKRLEENPPDVPFRIASVNSQLVAFSDPHMVNATAHMYQDDHWVKVAGKLPCTAGSGLFLDSASESNVAYVLGGEVNQQYSSQGYKLHFMTRSILKAVKKGRQIRMSE